MFYPLFYKRGIKAMRCPNCGYEPPKPPYEYTGHLKPHLDAILARLRQGQTKTEITNALGLRYHDEQAISYIAKKYGLLPKLKEPNLVAFPERNLEIIARQRSGERMTDLAREYGISPTRIAQLVRKAKRREERAQQ